MFVEVWIRKLAVSLFLNVMAKQIRVLLHFCIEESTHITDTTNEAIFKKCNFIVENRNFVR